MPKGKKDRLTMLNNSYEAFVHYLINHSTELENGCLITKTKARTGFGMPYVILLKKKIIIRNAILTYKLGRPLRENCSCASTCGNKFCVNPEHLYEKYRRKTLSEVPISLDAEYKKTTFCKHSKETVFEIIELYHKRLFSRLEISLILNISFKFVNMILSRVYHLSYFQEYLRNELKTEK